MHDPRHLPASDHLYAALEASYDTLICLQMIRALAPDERRVERQVTQAIESLRRAIAEIAELREAQQERQTAVTCGFVIETVSAMDADAGLRAAQSKPRRTA